MNKVTRNATLSVCYDYLVIALSNLLFRDPKERVISSAISDYCMDKTDTFSNIRLEEVLDEIITASGK